MITISSETLSEYQKFLKDQEIDGWLIYDFHNLNHFAREFLPLEPDVFLTRRYFYFMPAAGTPQMLLHHIERENFVQLPGEITPYTGWAELEAGLADILRGHSRIAMEYSPSAALPYVSMVDAGTIEMVRKCGVEIVPSSNIIQYFASRWTDEGYRLHMETVPKVHEIRLRAFETIAKKVRSGTKVTEYEIMQQIADDFVAAGLTYDHPPIVAVNEHAAMPHYGPTAGESSEIKAGDLVLIDMWCKQADNPEATYVDITWTGYLGEQVPDRISKIYDIVAAGRDAALALIDERLQAGKDIAGWEVDEACRKVITDAGYGEYFPHRTGHSIDVDVHGAGVNIDHLEVRDDRSLIKGVGFSIEPGIYLPGEFGVRSEIDAYIGENGLEVTTAPTQTEVLPLLSMF
jgi:Xaa-Pro aminopeptidase